MCRPIRKAAGSRRAAPPKAAGLSVRGPFRKAAGFRRAATTQGGWLWLRPPGGDPAVQTSSRSSQAVHTPRSDVQDGHTHCPQPGQSVRQRVSSMRAQREHWACAKAIHLLFASPWALGRRVP